MELLQNAGMLVQQAYQVSRAAVRPAQRVRARIKAFRHKKKKQLMDG